jgi:hypothetical protein
LETQEYTVWLAERGTLRMCRKAGCKVTIQHWNKSGYCHEHSKNLDYKLRRKAPAAWAVCKYCTRRVRSDSKSGCCVDHHLKRDRPPTNGKMQFCHEPQCDRILHGANKSGYCDQHGYAKNRPSVQPLLCRECEERLGTNNESGYCARHRHLSEESYNIRNKHKAKIRRALLLLEKDEPDPRITLAVCLENKALKPYKMKDQLFPDVADRKPSRQRELRYSRVKNLYKRNSEEFERERVRIGLLSESEQEALAQKAVAKIPRPK